MTDQHHFLLVPSYPSGFFASQKAYEPKHLLIFHSVPCPPGTYKNATHFGPCTACPPQTKNSGSQPSSNCQPCNRTSFCPLGAVGEISLHNYPSYTQTYSYPNNPDMNNYDDLLVQNIFNINQSRRCLLISPLFWTIIIITLCFIVWLLMTFLKKCKCYKAQPYRNQLKEFFKKTDILHEGERWVGGLLSFAIISLFTFTIWFASNFLQLYPIESSDISPVSCDDSLRNAVFESALQLPLPQISGSQSTIFDMLDTQPLTMTIDLLNTAANCPNITVQQNRPGLNHLLLPVRSCIQQQDNITRSISFLLPTHRTTVQMNITGPFFVGGMRLCLHGPGRIHEVNQLQSIDICQLFWTVNETLSRVTTIHMILIKVINVTKPLNIGGNTHMSGRWSPTFAERSLSDELLYEQDGQYLRYISERTIIIITLSEQPFYAQNIQEPIIRKAELAFHTLLFCTLIIELFGIGFLLYRLVIKPTVRTFIHCCCSKDNNKTLNDTVRQSSIQAT